MVLSSERTLKDKWHKRTLCARHNACARDGAHMYLILKTNGLPSETSVWTETLTTRVKHRFENLNAGQFITVRVYALGPMGKGEASDYCTVMAGM